MKELKWTERDGMWTLELDSPILALQVEDGKVYAITENGVAELPPRVERP